MRILRLGALLALLAFLPVSPTLLAQPESGATLTGSVLDQAGKSIQGAAVVIKNEATATTRALVTDSDGHFSVSGLPAGIYTIETMAPGFARNSRTGIQLSANKTEDLSISMSVEALAQAVTVEASVSLAAQLAPSGNTLEATSAKSEISGTFIKNFETPTADYGEVVNYSPGTFTLSPNGAGLGQGKIFFRGLGDGLYNITFDGIPFTDTNSVSHHTWANFPAQWIGSTDFDRSPGEASTVGQSTFGGSINLKSLELQADPDIRASVSYGSWDTRLLRMDFDSGLFGPGDRNSLTMDVHQMESDGYQTFNHQKRDAGSLKYQYRVSPRTTITLFSGVVDIWNNTPTNTSPTRAQVAEYGNNYLLSGDPGTAAAPNPYYYGFNKYHVQTDFEYIGFNSDLGKGWRLDNKAYTYRYWNSEVYPGTTINLSTSAPSGTDKLNGYRQAGDTAALSHEDKWGIFTVGIWYNWAYTDRYQIPRNPVTGLDTPLPNFHEHFITQSTQAFAQYTWRATKKLAITVGIKNSDQALHLDQYQDNGTVGCLGGTAAKDPVTGAPICIGNAVAFVTHSINWNNWLPTGTARYQVARNWSVYGQFAEGSEAPPTSIFDVTGGNVTTPAKATLAKTYQVGSVLKFNRWTLDTDAYYLHYQNGYASYTDIATGEPVNTLTGPSNTKGLEAESNIVIGHGFNVYLNGSLGSARYQTGPNYPNGGLFVANAPKNVETAGLFYQHKNWDIGFLHKRVGPMYDDNGTLAYVINGISLKFPVNQAIAINPFDVTNFFFNYTIKNEGWLRGSKIGFSTNNLFNNQNIVGISAATKATLAVPFAPSPNDLINTLPGRSVMISLTVGLAPRR
ncbi:MAG: TonB-dependent receptor [Bryobacteraceae bacterium]|jgi:iron complex outermembrane receptor protein